MPDTPRRDHHPQRMSPGALPFPDDIPPAEWHACRPDPSPTQQAQAAFERDVEALAKLHARVVRADGWTPDRQRLFLSHIADGHSVTSACALVGLSVASVYAFRQRAAGAAFAVGWDAARLLAREAIADTLTARAMEGQVERITRPDGSVVERFRYDNRLAAAMLTRLDRQVAATAEPATQAARLVASEFQAYLAQLGEGGPSRAALFLARRLAGAGAGSAAGALAPVVAMAHADSFVRANGAIPEEIDTSDLDVTDRAHWTAAQWARAEAAGLLTLVGRSAPDSQLPQLRVEENEVDDDPPVWFEDEEPFGDIGDWRTRFPPPPGFDGYEEHEYGHPGYWRDLTDAERAIVEATQGPSEIREEAEEARDRWFAALAGDPPDDSPAAPGDDRKGQTPSPTVTPDPGRGPLWRTSASEAASMREPVS